MSLGCSEDEYDIRQSVDPELMSYFDRFKLEGDLRKFNIDWNSIQISAKFETLEGAPVGQCAKLKSGIHEIRIEKNYWNKSNDINREFLIFHELGHCFLSRSHDNKENSKGECLSIMNSGEGLCKNVYNSATRAEYIDELFLNI